MCNIPQLFDTYVEAPIRRRNFIDHVKHRLITECSDNTGLLYLTEMNKLCDCTMKDCKIMTAKDSRTSEIVAVKVVSTSEEKNLVLIENEIRIMQDCFHPNLVELYECYYLPDSIWIEMEYCSRGTLGSFIRSGVPFTEERIASIMRHILRGVDYMHNERQIMHNDIKSDNILITEQYEIKISDFGLSRELRRRDQKRTSEAGTLYYMAPEQVELPQKRPCYGIEADIWACGIILYTMTKGGKPPHFGVESATIRELILNGPVPELNREEWSEAMCNFASCMLSKDPSQRLPACELLDHPFLKLCPSLEPTEFLYLYNKDTVDRIPNTIDKSKLLDNNDF
jgi:p21-activated kinase 1